jgi:hypothetical protein
MKAPTSLEPKPLKAFRDKYLAVVMMVAALLITSIVSAQTDSLKYSQINGYGFKYKRMAFDSVLMIPNSASPHAPYRAGALRYRASDSTLQIWTGYQWSSIVTGSTGIDTAYMLNDTVLAIETPGENYLLQVAKRHVDSLYRKPGQDSIFYKIYGVERAIKDSSGTNVVLTNVGTGFRRVTTPNGSIKTDIYGYGLNGDSAATANTITVQADTSETNHLVTQSDLNDAIAGVVISPAGSDRQIQINDAGVFGVQSGVSVTNQGAVVADSTRVLRHVVKGDSSIVKKIEFAKSSLRDGATVGFIGFSEEENQYETATIDNTTYWGIGTPEVGGTHSMLVKMENNWTPFPGATYRQKEFYLQIHYPTGAILRPISWTGSILGNDGTWIQRGNLNSYTDWDGRFNLGGFSRGVGEFTTYHNFSGSGNIKLHIVDSTIATGNTIAAGLTITGQIAGGGRLNTTAIHGQEIDYNWESAPVFRATAPSMNSSNFNYVFAIPNSNTGHRLIVNKGSGIFDDVAMWIHNDGRTVVGNANNFWPSYKFQAHNGINSFVFGDWDTDNTTILYSGAFSHRLTAGGGGTGMGAGYRFEADNGSNTPTTIADIAGVWNGTPTAGSENGDIIFRTRRAGTLTEAARVKANGHVSTTDEAYDATAWNGNTEVPTKNAIRDKIESLGTGITSINSMTGPAITIQGGTGTSVSSSTNTVTVEVVPSSTALAHTLDVQYVTQGNTGTSETDLFSYTLPANKLSVDGRTVNFEIDGEVNDNTATAQIKLYFGGNTTLNTGAINISTANTGWRLKGYIVRTSSTTAHVTYELHAPGLATAVFVGYNNLTSLDFTAGNIFKITAQAGGAGGGNSDITAHSWQVTYKPIPL